MTDTLTPAVLNAAVAAAYEAAAKAAAQADYEARILSALSDTPSPEAIVRAALERAADEYRRIACDELWSWEIEADLRALASDRAAVDQIIEQAKGRG